ncbi:replication protein A 32 kDa subunit B-like isoform X1 [Panicum virgatum]|uniref:replication protein A 32 kDa subunit B-like isoform X1 n=1 Tax=Panicum virgatum TaxID=38727 RepID=UPI0019D5011D|nr:replication protein A 32 kDa subunit B-like isoform X1 [Panicum virgatum]
MYGGGGHYGGDGGGAANANSLFGGGGFMPSQSTAVPESSGGVSKGRNAQTLLPLTVKQIMDAAQASDDKSNFTINGVEVSTVRLVGRMLGKIERVTDVQFTLDDGTGKIDVNRWENESSDTKEMADVNDGNYVIVNGGLKGFQGKRHVVAYSVRRVTNFNDITHHFLHCIYVHLELTRSKSRSPPQINSGTATPVHVNQVRPPNIQATSFLGSGNTSENDVSSLIMNVFHDPAIIDREDGITKAYVIERLKLPEDMVRYFHHNMFICSACSILSWYRQDVPLNCLMSFT